MWDWINLIVLVLVCVAAVGLTVVRMPGPWIIVVAGVLTGWLTGWQRAGAWVIGGLMGMAVLGELLEVLMSVITVRRAGASKKAAWGGLIGGFAGMFVFTPLIPVPVVGTLLGAMLGCFAGAMIGEHLAQKGLEQSARVGAFAAAGFAIGAVVKLALALAMSGLLVGGYVRATWFAAG